MKDLGWANWWGDKLPNEVLNCLSKGHKRDEEVIGKCVTQFTCKICQITYTVDSSD